jgi:hypothetical protein
MGAGGGKGAPAPPDFTAAATPTQNTPWATSSWTHGPSTSGHWSANDGGGFPGGNSDRHWITDPGPMTQTVGLNPQLDQANQSMMGQLGSSWATPLDNGQQARQHAENALYQQGASRLDPMWQQREQQFNSNLTNQGIDPNSAAGQQAMGSFGRDRNDAYSSLQNNASMLGGQEASRQQQMDLTSRAAPLAGMAGLQGLSGMPQNPLLSAAMAQYQGALQNYGIGQEGKNSTMGGLLGAGGKLGAAGILASDERVKEDVRRSAIEPLPGVPSATWRYRGGKQRYSGVIAQDLERAGHGHLVKEVGGVKMVDTAANPMVAPVEVDDDG